MDGQMEGKKPGKTTTNITDRCTLAVRQVTRRLDSGMASRCYHRTIMLDQLKAACR